MTPSLENNCSCGCGDEKKPEIIFAGQPAEAACCGPSPGPRSNDLEKPGYVLCGFVEEFIDIPAGAVPRVKRSLDRSDIWETVKVRLGINRNQYKVTPGLYCVGEPDRDSPVLVSANYKLSFDALRRALSSTHAWILVLDTRGVNVWCAAGKGTFSTAEIVRQVKASNVENVVSHRRLILPQLSATGVAAHQVKKQCGFTVQWGPVRAEDIETYITRGNKSNAAMRKVTFTLWERFVLVPVEITIHLKYLLWFLLIAFVLSGIGPGIFSFFQAWHRGWVSLTAGLAGIVAGVVVAPLLLPWIPGKPFSVKGAISGILVAIGIVFFFRHTVGALETGALILFITATSSYLAMNFTGTTPFTSPSGVEKEMRLAIPAQAGAILLAAGLWLGAAFAVT